MKVNCSILLYIKDFANALYCGTVYYTVQHSTTLYYNVFRYFVVYF